MFKVVCSREILVTDCAIVKFLSHVLACIMLVTDGCRVCLVADWAVDGLTVGELMSVCLHNVWATKAFHVLDLMPFSWCHYNKHGFNELYVWSAVIVHGLWLCNHRHNLGQIYILHSKERWHKVRCDDIDWLAECFDKVERKLVRCLSQCKYHTSKFVGNTNFSLLYIPNVRNQFF